MQQLEGVCFGFPPGPTVALKHLPVELLSPFYLLIFLLLLVQQIEGDMQDESCQRSENTDKLSLVTLPSGSLAGLFT